MTVIRVKWRLFVSRVLVVCVEKTCCYVLPDAIGCDLSSDCHLWLVSFDPTVVMYWRPRLIIDCCVRRCLVDFDKMSTNNLLIIAQWSTAIWSIISRCLSWDFVLPSRHRPTISLAYSRKTISRTSIDHRPTTVRLTTAYRSSIYRSTVSLTFCVRTETAYSKTGLGSLPLDARQWKWSKSSSASHRTNPDECRWTITWRACLTTE